VSRDESRAVDDTPVTNAEGEVRGGGGNSQFYVAQQLAINNIYD